MAILTRQEQELIFDYCLGITSEQETAQAQELILSSNEAKKLHLQFKNAFAPLESIEPEVVPEELTEKTVSRLVAAKSAQTRLRQLIAYEQSQQQAQPKIFARYISRFVSAAAVLLIVAGIWGSTTKYMRFQSQKAICQANLISIGKGLQSYRSDNNGQLPAVATVAGGSWLKVGYRPYSNENSSNTRHIWLIIRLGYIDKPTVFICPGAKGSSGLNYEKVQVANLHDFPSRQYISYSLRLRCPNAKNDINMGHNKVVMTDMNPLFSDLPKTFDDFRLQLNDNLQKSNSPNHNKKGQNILFCDGRVAFVKTRFVESDNDDVFTLHGTTLYRGNEFPVDANDSFVAP